MINTQCDVTEKPNQANDCQIVQTANQSGGWRLPAKALEQQIAQSILDHLDVHIGGGLFIEPDVEKIELTSAKLNVIRLTMNTNKHSGLLNILKKAIIKAGCIKIELDAGILADQLALEANDLNPDVYTFDILFQRRKRGVETKLVIGKEPSQEIDQTLINNIARAHQFYAAIKEGQTFDEVAASNGITKRRLLQIVDLAFLTPDIVKAIMIGDQPLSLTSKWLEKNPLPADWKEQREVVARL